MGIDTHAHVFSADAPAVQGARYRPAYAATLHAWRSRWPAAGIERGVLVQPSFFGTDNSEMIAALACEPRLLRGVGVVDPAASDALLDHLHEAGVRAIRLNLKGVADYAAHGTSDWKDLYDRVAAKGWHVEILGDAGRLPEVMPAFERSAATLVFDHFGAPGTTARAVEATFAAVARRAAKFPVWCKLSAPYRLEDSDPRILAAGWIAAVGPENLVWGSDWPFTGNEAAGDYGKLRAALDDWIEPRHRRAILCDNPARLYRFD